MKKKLSWRLFQKFQYLKGVSLPFLSCRWYLFTLIYQKQLILWCLAEELSLLNYPQNVYIWIYHLASDLEAWKYVNLLYCVKPIESGGYWMLYKPEVGLQELNSQCTEYCQNEKLFFLNESITSAIHVQLVSWFIVFVNEVGKRKFKAWTRLFVLELILMPLGKGTISFSPSSYG